MEPRTDTDNAPVVQLLLTVQFEPELTDLSIVDLADLFERYRERYPNFEQIVRAGPMSPDPITQTVTLAAPAMPRVGFYTQARDEHVLFQEDRLSVGWQRVTPPGEPSGYPGFSQVEAQLMSEFDTLRSWLRDRFEVEIAPVVAEVSYTDMFPLHRGDVTLVENIGDVFRFAEPGGERPILFFSNSWAEPLGENGGHVQSTASGPLPQFGGLPGLQLESTARIDSRGPWSTLPRSLEIMHSHILEIFREVVKPEAYAKS